MSETMHHGSDVTGMGTALMAPRIAVAVVEACSEAVRTGLEALAQRRDLAALAPQVEVLEEALTDCGYKPSTARKYALIVFRFLHETGRRPGHDDVKCWLVGLNLSGCGNAVLRVALCALRAVFDRILNWGITEGIGHVPAPPPRVAATELQVEALLGACENPVEEQVVRVLFEHKLMPHELCRLGSFDGIDDLAAATGLVVRGCGRPGADSGRDVEPPFRVLRNEYPGTVWMFPSPSGKGPLSTRTLRRRIHALGLRCGFEAMTCTAIRRAVPIETLVAA